MSKPYDGTEVSIEKSQMQIDELLAAHRISDIRWTTTSALKLLEFHHAVREELDEWCYSRTPTCPKFARGSHYAHKKIRIRAVLGVRIVVTWPTADERERRRLMRVLWWMLKSKFEIVDAGLVVFEEEFMPHLTLGQGRRMWDAFRPELERRIEEGTDLSAGIGDDAADRLLAIGAGSR
ncbi:MAG TPA: hypothetical protein VGS01_09575 [Candidatus Limnocylindria bacterium]|jgi:hypothetical protein|nr:hypothetical protein [Candidatus Limnocylindria bacterium]